ncbi:MAG: GTPase [Pigmentiphaga sp.]
MTTRRSAGPDGAKRGQSHAEPKAPPNRGGEGSADRPGFFTTRRSAGPVAHDGVERSGAQHDILAVLPARAHDLARLRVLAAGGAPVVTVIGKYNHGKSRLLNELLGHDVFAVADRRQTVALADREQDGVRWLDAPGIDADVDNEDDRQALQAAWLESDIRLFVHAAKEGELDARELALLETLRADSERTARQLLFVLSQVDQLADEGEFDKVLAVIAQQLPGVPLHPVSSTRHRRGVEGGKTLMVERSGIPRLRDALTSARAAVPQARGHETTLLFDDIRAELQTLHERHEAKRSALRSEQQQQRLRFTEGLDAVFAKVGADLRAVIDVPGPDPAQTVDTAADHYRQTAAKLERARIQVAYSRACIEIDGYLVGQGVSSLPSAQRTGARAMDSVMVAVMGVSVKHRADLRRLFCEPAGAERLQRDFLRYFELSRDRLALAETITATEAAVATAKQALSALRALEAMA